MSVSNQMRERGRWPPWLYVNLIGMNFFIFILVCFCTNVSCLCVESSALVCQVLIGSNLCLLCVSQSSDSSSGFLFIAQWSAGSSGCVLAQQGFLFSSARIVCVGFSRSTAAGLRYGLRVLNFHCPVLFFSTAGVVFLLISFLHSSLVQRELGAHCCQ
jgi:hypothetical protein